MIDLDGFLSGQLAGHGALVVLLIAFALGLRHASDPDHLVAVSTLVAGTRERAARRAAVLGASWGAGHAATLLVFGLPVLLLHAYLPAFVEGLAATAIGLIIAVLAARLLVRWRRGAFHVHPHEHDGTRHLHVHSHVADAAHAHRHDVRSPAQAFSIGLVHGMAGSAGVAVLIVAAVPDRLLGALALFVLVAGCALSMTLLSAGFGRLLGFAVARRAFATAVPVLGFTACAFGVWYAATAAAEL